MWIASAHVVAVPLSGPHTATVRVPGSRPVLALLRRGCEPASTIYSPTQRVLSSDFAAGVLIGPSSQHLAPEIIAAGCRIADREPSTCVVFVQERDPPSVIYREDPPIDTILVPASTFRDAVSRSRDPEHAAYLAASAVLRDASVRQLLVRTIAAPERPEGPVRAEPTTILVPHRGPLEMLRTCVHYITHQWAPCERTQVYFDEDLSDGHGDWLARNPEIEAYRSNRPGAGPYPGRHYLARHASTPWIMFQDSDDAPCSDRVARLSAAVSEGELIGSHEVRLDDIHESFYPVRYPLDVNAALSLEGGHALLHPTSMIRKTAYVRCGGFSTNRVMSSDTQFLLRAHFSMRIRNIDAFLYLKRDRAGSLTRSPATMLGSPERVRLDELWLDAFRRVQKGEEVPERTALAPERRRDILIERIG